MANISAQDFLGGGDFKVLSADEFLGGGDFTIQEQASSANTQINKPNPNSVGGFVANQFLGAGPLQKDEGLGASLVSNTIGNKGVAGVAQLPGRVAAAKITSNVAEDFSKAAAALQETNNKLAAAYSTVPPEKRDELNKTIQENAKMIDMLFKRANGEELQDYNITAEQALGTGLNAATTVAPFGVGQMGAAKTVAQKAIGGAATGAAYGAGGAMVQDKDIKNVAKDAFIGGVTGGATSALLAGAGKVIDNYIKPAIKKAPEQIYNSALRVNQKLIEKGRSPSSQMIDEGVFGTLGGLYKDSNSAIKAINGQIEKKLSDTTKVSSKSIYDSAYQSLKKSFSNSYSEAELRAALEKVPANLLKSESVGVKALNSLRQELDGNLGGAYFVSDAASKLNKDAMGALSNTIRGIVQKSSGTQAEFSRLSGYIRANKLVTRILAQQDKKFGLGFKDLLAGTIGATINPAAAVGAVALEKGAGSTAIKTTTAVGLDRLIKTVSQLPTDQAGKISKTALLNLLSKSD